MQIPPHQGEVPEGRRGGFSFLHFIAKQSFDTPQHLLYVFEHVLIFKSDFMNPLSFQVVRSLLILLGRDQAEMHLSIQLNGQRFRRTKKIKDIGANTMLSAKLSSLQLPAF